MWGIHRQWEGWGFPSQQSQAVWLKNWLYSAYLNQEETRTNRRPQGQWAGQCWLGADKEIFEGTSDITGTQRPKSLLLTPFCRDRLESNPTAVPSCFSILPLAQPLLFCKGCQCQNKAPVRNLNKSVHSQCTASAQPGGFTHLSSGETYHRRLGWDRNRVHRHHSLTQNTRLSGCLSTTIILGLNQCQVTTDSGILQRLIFLAKDYWLRIIYWSSRSCL